MTTTDQLTPHIYGAGELGVLSVTAPGAAHPRVRYIGAELFVGLDKADGTWVNQGEAEVWERPFSDVLIASFAAAGDVPEPQDGFLVIDNEVLATAILNEPSRLVGLGVKGAPVVWALARTTVVISGADDERGIAKVLELAEGLYESEAPLASIHPVVVEGAEWAPYNWTAATEAQEMPIHRAIRLFGVRAYEAQTIALERPDVHVADPKIHVREDGITVTFAAWPKGTATLLPVTDSVMVADPSGSISVAAFDEFLDAAGELITKTGLSPTRYFIAGKKANA
jgi:hypothetical protein